MAPELRNAAVVDSQLRSKVPSFPLKALGRRPPENLPSGPPHISHAIEDAAPVSPTQFVTIRLSVGGHLPKATVDLAWVEFRNS
jgi:hypothetical protein